MLTGQYMNLTKDKQASIKIIDAYRNKVRVMKTDIPALNGMVHSVDYVLRPQ